MASQRLTVYLMREDVVDYADARIRTTAAEEFDLSQGSGVEGRFYRVQSPPKTPPWASFVGSVLDRSLTVLTSSASGLLLVRSSGRIFALTFGYGRSLLDLSKIEFQFGLRVALNLIDPRQLRSLDTKTFEDVVVTTSTQASRSTELPTFGVDISSDILRAATGEPRDTTLSKRLSGADALVLSTTRKPEELASLLDELLLAFQSDAYKADFAWIDQLHLVNRVDVIDELNEQLVHELQAADTSNTHLAVPEAIDWADVDAFKIVGTRAHEYEDLDLDEYLSLLSPGPGDPSVQALQTRRVSIRFSRSDTFESRWTLFQCLVSEQRLGGQLYALIEGRWFEISESLVDQVDDYIASLPAPVTPLIPADKGEQEAHYNARLAASAPDNLLNLDAKIRRPGGAASGIELCDVLTAAGEFIHVKRKSRSATLSHLFAQGSVSAETFTNDGPFRDQIRDLMTMTAPAGTAAKWLDLVPGSSQVVDRTKGYRVTYAVVTDSTKAGTDWLPFFSRLNLMQHAKRLRNLGFEVSVTRVPLTKPT